VVISLGVRVKLKLESMEGVQVETSALVSSGFESDEPDIALPATLAKTLVKLGQL